VLTTETFIQRKEFPSLDDLAEALELYEVDHSRLDHITFSGNGEPTYHPEFGRAVDIVTAYRNRSAPQAKTAILSNSTQVHRPEIRQALMKLDRRIMKLDAGSEEIFRKINRPPREVKFEAIVEGLKALNDFETQTIFINGHISNSGDDAVRDWIETLKIIRPKSAQIYTLVRTPADKKIRAVSRERLEEICAQARSEGLPVEVY
jgi:wyosine [tRNA(Phe)-imidazoG37] synthetase (radical SAM superfamily)